MGHCFSCPNSYHKVIGTNNGVTAHAQCDICFFKEIGKCCFGDFNYYVNKDLTGLKENIYTGVKWQCVEYSRRWLILVLGINFESVGCAYEIFPLKHCICLRTNTNKEFITFENGNSSPPKKCDLLIWKKAKPTPYGHVAVITGIKNTDDSNIGYVEICEQNHEHGCFWKADDYSRRLTLIKDNLGYTVLDINYNEDLNLSLDENFITTYSLDILGWKRVGEYI